MSKIFAHRGFSGKYPENTMLAFREAVKTYNVEIIESDLYLTKDGYLVYNHDDYIDETCNINGDMTLDQVEDLCENKKNRHYIEDMTLEECRALGINRVRVVDPYDLKACDVAIKEELAAEEPSVIISRRPCVLLKSVKALPPLKVDADKCKSCKRCMTLGCPAISMKDGKAVVDATLCVGCGVCKQLCAFDAFQ